MAEATDAQMQAFANQRVRVRAEVIRNLRASCLDDKASLNDVYERAVGPNRWNDARGDGPPHLLMSGSSASPDDMLVYNTFITLFEKFMTGTFENLNEANNASAQWNVLQNACVRPINS